MIFAVCLFWYLIAGRLFSRCSSMLLIPCSSSSCICANVGRQIIGSVGVVVLVSCCCGVGVWFKGVGSGVLGVDASWVSSVNGIGVVVVDLDENSWSL